MVCQLLNRLCGHFSPCDLTWRSCEHTFLSLDMGNRSNMTGDQMNNSEKYRT